MVQLAATMQVAHLLVISLLLLQGVAPALYPGEDFSGFQEVVVERQLVRAQALPLLRRLVQPAITSKLLMYVMEQVPVMGLLLIL